MHAKHSYIAPCELMHAQPGKAASGSTLVLVNYVKILQNAKLHRCNLIYNCKMKRD